MPGMRRREFVTLLGGAAAACGRLARGRSICGGYTAGGEGDWIECRGSVVGCRYSHFGGLHGRDLAPLWRGFFVRRGPNREPWGVGLQPGWVTVCFT